jgi:hypothetical protein
MKIAALAFLGMMVVHVMVRPEGGWVLLATCDVAALATVLGVLADWHRPVAVAFVFQAAIGMPAFAVGLLTTYELNPTGVAVHVVPAVMGGIAVARHGMPRGAALHGFLGYAATFITGYLVAPPALNVNFASFVWPPLAGVFDSRGTFRAALFAATGILLVAGELVTRRLAGEGDRARAARPAAP